MTGLLGYLDGGSASVFVAVAVLFLAATIWGLVDAITRHQTGWWVGILVGWLFGLGWLVAIIYLLAIRPKLRREQEALGSGSGAPPISDPPPPPPDDIIS